VKWALNTVHVVSMKINSFTSLIACKLGSELVKKGRDIFGGEIEGTWEL
jgi:hypothetical protein